MNKINFESRILDLGYIIPEAPAPQGSYLPCRVVGNLAFMSGVLPMEAGVISHSGIVGVDVTLDEARAAARICIFNLLSNLKAEIGDLNRIEAIIRLGGFVASAADFGDHPGVINAASDLLVEIFGDVGRHSRAAVGVASLPRNACVEIDAIISFI